MTRMCRLVVFIGGLLWAGSVEAATYNLANCNQLTIQTQVNASVDGDIIVLPTCNVTWAFSDVVTLDGRAITIKGGGIGVTIIRKPNADSGNTTIFSWGTKSTGGIHRISGMTLISGSCVTTACATNEAWALISLGGNTRSLVIDNIRFETNRNHSVNFEGDVRGVVANFQLQFSAFSAQLNLFHTNWNGIGVNGHNSWAMPHTMGCGTPVSAAGNCGQSITFEDGVITGPNFQQVTGYPCTDGEGGPRFVIRFSRLTNCQAVTHGLDTPGPPHLRGTRQEEAYRNVLSNTQMGYASPFAVRSGTGIFFDNVLTTSGIGFSPAVIDAQTQRGVTNPIVENYPIGGICRPRAISSITCNASGVATATLTSGTAGTFAGTWMQIQGASVADFNGNKATTTSTYYNNFFTFACSALGQTANNAGITAQSPFDGNTQANGYPCMDQVGRGPGVLLNNGSDALGRFGGPVLGPAAPVKQTPEPIYSWNNRRNGVLQDLAYNVNGTADNTVVQANRDYYNQQGANCPANPAGNCASGVGRGTRANRPATCTVGTAYVSTDGGGNWNQEDSAMHMAHDPSSVSHTLGEDGGLDVCTASGWSNDYYVPYTYPHPLLSGIPSSPPTTPVISINSPAVGHWTSNATVTLAGGCTDDTALPAGAVTWSNSTTGGSGTATGTGSWTITNAAINVGINNFTVTCNDGTSSAMATLDVLRESCGTGLPYTSSFTLGGTGTSWPTLPCFTHYGGGVKYSIASNAATVSESGTFDVEVFTGQLLLADHYIKARITDINPYPSVPTKQMRLCVRATGQEGNNTGLNAIWVQIDGSDSPNNFLARYVNGEFDTVLQYFPGLTFTVGTSTAKIQAIGNEIKVFVDPDGAGALPEAQIGTTYTIPSGSGFTTGLPGLCPTGAGTTWDDVEIDNATAPGEAIYYVDGSCGVNGDGTTQICGTNGPWNDLASARGINNNPCAAGDRILIKNAPAAYVTTNQGNDPSENGGFYITCTSGVASNPYVLTAFDITNPPVIANCALGSTTYTQCARPTFTCLAAQHIEISYLKIIGGIWCSGVQTTVEANLPRGLHIHHTEITQGWGEVGGGNWSGFFCQFHYGVNFHHNYLHNISITTGGGAQSSMAGIKIFTCPYSNVEFNTVDTVIEPNTQAGCIDDKQDAIFNTHRYNYCINVPHGIRIQNQQNMGSPYYGQQSHGVVVEHNVFAVNVGGNCLRFEAGGVDNIIFRNNTCYGSMNSAWLALTPDLGKTTQGIQAYNNIIIGSQKHLALFLSNPAFSLLDYDIWDSATPAPQFSFGGSSYATLADVTQQTGLESHGQQVAETAVQFTNATARNFQIGATSVAQAACRTGGLATGSTIDCGAYTDNVACLGWLCGSTGPPPDSIPPNVAIAVPTAAATYATSISPLPVLSGVASDASGVSSCTWNNNRGGAGSTVETATWSVANITLAIGQNVLTISCTDTAGNVGGDTLIVTYTPLAPALGSGPRSRGRGR